jgi:hypothetical protein
MKKNKETEITLSYEELMQLSLSVITRLGVVQTRWASGVANEQENAMLLSLLNNLNILSQRLDNELKKLNGEN